MVEYTALMWWDHVGSIQAIAPQPMCLIFSDGGRHYPDFFGLDADGTQVLYDVRPEELIDEKAAAQFMKTELLCRKVGWRYEVFTGVDRVVRHNLEWLAAYRNERCRPDQVLTGRVLGFLDHPRPFMDVLLLLDLKLPVKYVSQLYNLMWNRQVYFDLSTPLSQSTLIWKA
jgi:hypothetical protein